MPYIIYTYIHIYIHTYIHTYIYTYIHTYIVFEVSQYPSVHDYQSISEPSSSRRRHIQNPLSSPLLPKLIERDRPATWPSIPCSIMSKYAAPIDERGFGVRAPSRQGGYVCSRAGI
jgi:hypothetical protein